MWVQNLYSGLPVGETEQVSLGDIPAGSHLPKGTWKQKKVNPRSGPAGETAHPRSGSRRLTQPQVQSPREPTSAKSHSDDSFRRRVRDRSVRDVQHTALVWAALLALVRDPGAPNSEGGRGTGPWGPHPPPAPRATGGASAGGPSAQAPANPLSVIRAELK